MSPFHSETTIRELANLLPAGVVATSNITVAKR
jgi:hypothetical protein